MSLIKKSSFADGGGIVGGESVKETHGGVADVERIKELESEVDYLERVVASYKARESAIKNSENEARLKADQIVKASQDLFELEFDRIMLFKNSLKKVTASVGAEDKQKIQRLTYIAESIEQIFSGDGSQKDKLASAKRLVDENGVLIKNAEIHIGDGENGFDLSDVINPSEGLSLEELCREMGLMED